MVKRKWKSDEKSTKIVRILFFFREIFARITEFGISAASCDWIWCCISLVCYHVILLLASSSGFIFHDNSRLSVIFSADFGFFSRRGKNVLNTWQIKRIHSGNGKGQNQSECIERLIVCKHLRWMWGGISCNGIKTIINLGIIDSIAKRFRSWHNTDVSPLK